MEFPIWLTITLKNLMRPFNQNYSLSASQSKQNAISIAGIETVALTLKAQENGLKQQSSPAIRLGS